jgi:signal transduction histidine kinase
MRERLHLVGGVMSIRSEPQQGTKLDVRVPIGSSTQTQKFIPFRKAA